MLAKKDLMRLLDSFGFIKRENSKTAGSHISYYHKKYTTLIVGIDDHKDTKDMSKRIYNDVINAITMITLLESKNDNNSIEKILEKAPRNLANNIKTKLKKVNSDDKTSMSQFMSRSMIEKIKQTHGKTDNETIEEYLISME